MVIKCDFDKGMVIKCDLDNKTLTWTSQLELELLFIYLDKSYNSAHAISIGPRYRSGWTCIFTQANPISDDGIKRNPIIKWITITRKFYFRVWYLTVELYVTNISYEEYYGFHVNCFCKISVL